MTDFISAVPGATVNPVANATSNSIAAKYGIDATPESSELDRDAFLKLLVAQLRYQDPLNPSDPGDFIATTAQFTTIEELQKMSAQAATSTLNSSLTTASSLIGRTVTVIGDTGFKVSAVVERAQVANGEVKLVTSGGEVALDEVVEIAG